MDKVTQQNLLALVRRNYEAIAVDFDNTRKKHLWPELIKLAGLVKDGDKVLDVGCGNGQLIEAFKEKKIDYLGVDSSERLIAAAKRNQKLGIKNQEFLMGNILELDKISEKDFDYVVVSGYPCLERLSSKTKRIHLRKFISKKLVSVY